MIMIPIFFDYEITVEERLTSSSSKPTGIRNKSNNVSDKILFKSIIQISISKYNRLFTQGLDCQGLLVLDTL